MIISACFLQYLDMKEQFEKLVAGGKEKGRDDFTEVKWLALDYLGVASIEGRQPS